MMRIRRIVRIDFPYNDLARETERNPHSKLSDIAANTPRSTPVTSPQIAIVGAGIAGLAAAAALQNAGVDVVAYEQASRLGEVGAGVSLTQNSLRVIRAIGLMDELDKTAVELQNGMVLYSHSGQRLGGPSAASGGGGRNVHRADLVDTLKSQLAPGTVKLKSKLVGVRDAGDHVELEFADGSTETAAGLIGADGIHSVARTAVQAESDPVFSGMIAYRGLIPAERMPDWPTDEATMYVGDGRHFLVFPVRNRNLLNFVAFVAADEEMQESWSAPGDPAQLAAEFEGWAEPVREFISKIDSTFKWGLYDREPLERWSTGRIALAGDAAHALLPHAGQGANQSIEDAAALAVVLEGRGADQIVQAFDEYNTARRDRGSFIQLFARRLGLEYDNSGADRMSSSGEPQAEKAIVNAWIKEHDVWANARAVRAGYASDPLPAGAPV
jgi:salicylate hydroxylase